MPLDRNSLECCYDAAGRWYKIPELGCYLPSITTILRVLSDEGIARWRDRIGATEADRISNSAKERGTAMHDILEEFCCGRPIPKDHSEALWLARQIMPELRACCTKVHFVEQQLWSGTLKTAGRCDLIGDWEGKPSIIDFKTAKERKREAWIESYLMQCCFYSVAAWQRLHLQAKQVVVIIANDEGQPQVFKRDAKPYLETLMQARRKFHEVYGDRPRIAA